MSTSRLTSSTEELPKTASSKSAQVTESLQEWFSIRRKLKTEGKTIGFVPTMGALHAGHASLMERSRRDNDVTVLSIYVNPTQFDHPEDLAKYPSTIEHDRRVADAAGVDFILLPTYPQIYPDGFRYKLSENNLALQLCGAHRPGHFDGVLTIVMKLLNVVQADHAYFGEKDHQQLELIRGMVDAFFLPTEIVACATHRETDGLAMSSRNVRLTPDERERAPAFYKVLRDSASATAATSALTSAGFDVDYVEDIGSRRYGAVKIGAVRLIDNVER